MRISFSPTAPLYRQVHLDASFLHLNGHATQDAPTSEVRSPVLGLQEFCDYLNDKKLNFLEAVAVEPR